MNLLLALMKHADNIVGLLVLFAVLLAVVHILMWPVLHGKETE